MDCVQVAAFQNVPCELSPFFIFPDSIAFGSLCTTFMWKEGFKQVLLRGPRLCSDIGVLMTTHVVMDLKVAAASNSEILSSAKEDVASSWDWEG